MCFTWSIAGPASYSKKQENSVFFLIFIWKEIEDFFTVNTWFIFPKLSLQKFKHFIQGTTVSQEEWEEDVYGPELIETLKQVDGRWALVSKKTGRPLRYYKGEGKPSDEWIAQQEKEIQYFKNMG